MELLRGRWAEGKFACVGLDSELGKIPQVARVEHEFYPSFTPQTDVIGTLVRFNELIIEATKDLVCAYKPNVAFYEAHGPTGIDALRVSIEYVHKVAPDVPVVLDAKDADIGNTNKGYVQFAFDHLKADAITVHPYLGGEALKPFLDRADKGIIILCRTSNPGAGEFQDLPVMIGEGIKARTVPLYQLVARNVAEHWNANGNCGVVVGATYPEELAEVRKIVGDMPILIPGIGAQGGDAEKTVKAGKDSRGQGMIINSSRGIIFASQGDDFAVAARREAQKLSNLINLYR